MLRWGMTKKRLGTTALNSAGELAEIIVILPKVLTYIM
jgi:hypothetical protein